MGHMGQTIVEKIAQAHMTSGPTNRPVRAGDFLSLRPRCVMTHDNTSAVMKKFRELGVEKVHDASRLVFALDHDIQNVSESNLAKYRSIEAFAREQGVEFYPAGRGIGHQLMVENGHALPGALVVASDSHSNMYGGVGALGTPVVRTDAAAIWATGEFWWMVPPAVQVVLRGRLRPGVTGKDVIIALCGLYNREEVLNAAVEFGGPGVASLGMDGRLAIANMSTEWGALAGWFPVDDVTLAYFKGRAKILEARGIRRIRAEDLEAWAARPPAPDPDARYAARIELDLDRVTPHVAGPDTVGVMTSLPEMEDRRVAIRKAYLMSCVNGRDEDLAAAAAVLHGKKTAPGVTLYVAAASEEVQCRAENAGIWKVFADAGAVFLPPGCGACIGLGAGLLEPGEVGISATNRNFKGRMGSRDAQCYLASPAVVAASAVAGYIAGPAEWKPEPIERRMVRDIEVFENPRAAETVDILPGFPSLLRGRLVFLPQDNLNTDGIYGKDYTYREDITRERMAEVVMENYDPGFAKKARAGDVVVGGFNFGTGSSREQAVTALQAKGIPLVIAGSFSETYLRNAYNNGFLCVACGALVTRLREALTPGGAAKEKTIVPGDEIEVEFTSGTIRWRGEAFSFPPLGTVPQSLVIAGGVENLVRKRLGVEREKD